LAGLLLRLAHEPADVQAGPEISFEGMQRRLSSRGGVPFLEKWAARWRSSQDGSDEQMFGAKQQVLHGQSE
jgi:hypothetical protein